MPNEGEGEDEGSVGVFHPGVRYATNLGYYLNLSYCSTGLDIAEKNW